MKYIYNLLLFILTFLSAKASEYDEFMLIFNITSETGGTITYGGIGTHYTIKWEQVDYESTTFGTKYVVGDEEEITITVPHAGWYRLRVDPATATSFYGYKQVIDKHQLIAIANWGSIKWRELSGAFENCHNLELWANDYPNLIYTTDLSNMFKNCSSFRGNRSFDYWNTSTITNMSGMFSGCSNFNFDISSWNVRNVSDMSYMFYDCQSFNQNVGLWNVKYLNNAEGMFGYAIRFNQDLGSWAIDSLVNTKKMFYNAQKFNQNINDWKMDHVINAESMFENAKVFNQKLDNWHFDKLTNIKKIFANAEKFNHNINDWNVSKVENFDSALYNATSFNQILDKWTIKSSKPEINHMFYRSNMNCYTYGLSIKGWSLNAETTTDIAFKGGLIYNMDHISGRIRIEMMNNWEFIEDTLDHDCVGEAPLSLNTIDLSGNVVEGVHHIQWQLNNISDIQSLTLESSNNGKNFNTLSEMNIDQHFFMNNPIHDITYYRIKLITSKQENLYSNIISISNKTQKSNITIYPNPAEDYITINHIKKASQVMIFNLNGSLVQENSITPNDNKINIATLPAGTYLVKIDGETQWLIKK